MLTWFVIRSWAYYWHPATRYVLPTTLMIHHSLVLTGLQTASLLTFVTYFLTLHPNISSKLRAEVLEHCGLDGELTYKNVRHLKYSTRHNRSLIIMSLVLKNFVTVRAVLNETLRLFPPVPLNTRQSRSTPCTLPPADPTYPSLPSPPLYFPKNTNFVYIPLLTQRNPVLWGHDADVFDPERWLDPQRLRRLTSDPMMFTPFSAGPRIVRPTLSSRSASCWSHTPSHSAWVRIMLTTRHLTS